MPSPESTALRDHLTEMASRVAANPDIDIATMRDIVEALGYRQREPTEANYEETELGGVPAMWVRPASRVAGRVVLYAHGGGFFAHTMHTSRKLVGHLAKATNATALIPDYRRAPEHPFPAQLQDVSAVYRALLDSDIDNHHVALAGESAGGNLATALVVKLKAEGGPLPAAIVAFSPWFDLNGESEGFEREPQTDVFLSREMSSFMASMFLGETTNAHDPLASPQHADLTGFPPMYVTAAGDEALAGAVETFAEKARGQGVDVTLHIADGMQHAFQWMAGRAPEADQDIANAGRWLQQHLAS